MPCCLGLLGFFAPRVVIVLLVIFSDYIGRACETNLYPFLGFLFLPFTTLVYAWAINTHGAIDGMYLAAVIVAVLVDLGVIGGNARGRRRRDDD